MQVVPLYVASLLIMCCVVPEDSLCSWTRHAATMLQSPVLP